MDLNKLHQLIERDEVWAEARDSMPLFEKFFAGDSSDIEDAKIGWISIKLITTELYTFNDEILNIDKEILDLYYKVIEDEEIDTLKFANREIDLLKGKIIKVGKNEETREEVESNLENIRKDVKNIRLIFLYNMSKYYDSICKMFLDVKENENDWIGEFSEEEQQAVIARCKIMTYYLLLLKEVEIQSLDGSWFK